MRGAAGAGEGFFAGVGVDGDDRRWRRRGRRLGGGEPDAAAADDGDGFAGAGLCGEGNGADAGGDGAADEGGDGEGDVVADRDERLVRDDGVRREGGEAAPVERLLDRSS